MEKTLATYWNALLSDRALVKYAPMRTRLCPLRPL